LFIKFAKEKKESMTNQLYKLLLLCVIFVSCSEGENECSYEANSPTLLVEGPNTTSVNQPINLDITYEVISECGNFKSFSEQVFGNNTEIIIKARYEGCDCPQMLTNKITTYTFNKSQAGTYVLKFRTFNNFIEHTIEVTN
jgi:hypothetical protein